MGDIANRYFDLSNPYDLQAALRQHINTYMDCYRYWLNLENLIESYDETLEHSDFASWINCNVDPENMDQLGMAAMASLRESADLFDRIRKRAEKNLIIILSAALAAPADIQLMVLGDTYSVESDKLNSLLPSLFDEITEAGFDGAEERPLEFFLVFLKEFLRRDDG